MGRFTSAGLLRIAVIMLAAVFTVPSSASILTITETENFAGISNFDSLLTFNQFDSSLGTLESVEITLSMNITGGYLIIDNDSEESTEVTVDLTASALLTSSDVTLAPSITATASTTLIFDLAADNGDGPGTFDSNSPDGVVHTGIDITTSYSQFMTSTAAFIGTGTFDLTASVTSNINLSSTGGIEGILNPLNAAADVTVQYSYTPVPEPATVILLGLGSMIFMRKK